MGGSRKRGSGDAPLSRSPAEYVLALSTEPRGRKAFDYRTEKGERV